MAETSKNHTGKKKVGLIGPQNVNPDDTKRFVHQGKPKPPSSGDLGELKKTFKSPPKFHGPISGGHSGTIR